MKNKQEITDTELITLFNKAESIDHVENSLICGGCTSLIRLSVK